MKSYSGFFFLKQSINGLVKNSVQSLTSILVLTIGIVFVGCFMIIIMMINENVGQINSLNEIIVFVEDANASDDEIKRISAQIYALEDNIEVAKYISGEDGMASMREDGEFDETFRNLLEYINEEKVLPDSFVITYKDAKRVETLLYQLGQIEGIKIKHRLDTAKSLASIKNAITIAFVWVLLFIIGFSITLIVNTIKLSVYSRRNEINLMRYIGATNTFIVTPFVMEGVIIGLISSLLAYGAQWYIYNYIILKLIAGIDLVNGINYDAISPVMFLAFIGAGVFLGVLSSSFSTRKYMKV